MLIEFTVENYKSFRDKATLSMVASADKSILENTMAVENGKKRILKSAIIFGANASGKSNLVTAFEHLRALVLASHAFQQGAKLQYFPFKLDKKKVKSPTRFEIHIFSRGVRYWYGVSFNQEKIVDEFLYSYPNGRQTLIFKRDENNDYKFTTMRGRQKFIVENTPANVLYLSRATQLNFALTLPVVEWFRSRTGIIIPGSNDDGIFQFTAKAVMDNLIFKKEVLKALSVADLDIEDIDVDIKPFNLDAIPIPEEVRRGLNSMFPPGWEDALKQTKITTKHKGVSFSFDEESVGTRKFFMLMGPWLASLKSGQLVIVDELETSLHPMLSLHLVKMFHDPRLNKNGAQLIFTTHNMELMDQDLFRRDQIWITEKEPGDRCTRLYSIDEYKPRKDKNLKNGYLDGRYGGIPFIRNRGS